MDFTYIIFFAFQSVQSEQFRDALTKKMMRMNIMERRMVLMLYSTVTYFVRSELSKQTISKGVSTRGQGKMESMTRSMQSQGFFHMEEVSALNSLQRLSSIGLINDSINEALYQTICHFQQKRCRRIISPTIYNVSKLILLEIIVKMRMIIR
ncbi:hypothetical protein FGO68_gene4460 [Halteria grandinella]|uniref:Uncharacterized protein n=1 Tax=Halteria grandinella TaxID=5974 RepID=A0A8J8P537_HALGN|nr:hypothetical protein FGO68_gene4460 [Halteria grandinella]